MQSVNAKFMSWIRYETKAQTCCAAIAIHFLLQVDENKSSN